MFALPRRPHSAVGTKRKPADMEGGRDASSSAAGVPRPSPSEHASTEPALAHDASPPSTSATVPGPVLPSDASPLISSGSPASTAVPAASAAAGGAGGGGAAASTSVVGVRGADGVLRVSDDGLTAAQRAHEAALAARVSPEFWVDDFA